MSLCVSLSLPYLTASSYGHSAIAECYPPVELPQRGPCWVCNNAPANKEVVERVTPDRVGELASVEFLPQVHEWPRAVCVCVCVCVVCCLATQIQEAQIS